MESVRSAAASAGRAAVVVGLGRGFRADRLFHFEVEHADHRAADGRRQPGRLVESRNRVLRPSLYLGASGWIFLSLIIHWFNVSAYRGLEFERNYESLLFFLPSIFAAGTAFILTPTLSSEGDIDLEEHYFSVIPWAFRSAAAYTALAGLSHFLLLEQRATPPLVSLTLTSILVLVSYSTRPRLHQVALSVLGVMLLANLAFGTR